MVQADATMNRLPVISRFAALCLLVIFVVCGGYGLNTLLAPHLIRAAGDHLSIAQVAQRQADFAATPLLVVSGMDRDREFKFITHLNAPWRGLMAESFANGFPVEAIVGLKLWDDAAADGDMVQIRSAGYTETLLLSDVPRNVYIPIILGVPVRIRGVHAGRGGGITVSVAAQRALTADEALWQNYPRKGFVGQEGKSLALPLLREGQTVELLLRPQGKEEL